MKLGELLLQQLPKFDNKRIRLAEAIGITPSRLTRAIKGDYALDVRNCLQLAKVADLSPSLVLRSAGKDEIASLTEELYGPGPELNAIQRRLVEISKRVPDARVLEDFLVMLEHYAIEPSAGAVFPARRSGRRETADSVPAPRRIRHR